QEESSAEDVQGREAALSSPGRSRTANDRLATEHQRGNKKQKASPHRVLGTQAVRHEQRDDLENVIVDVEITDWPTATQNARGRVLEILGYEDDFGVDVEIIIRKFHLPHRFPPEVLKEAQETENVIP